jgi:D-alanyl-D-alanine carboxypeptidase (penicillin-binding protein 5/6)
MRAAWAVGLLGLAAAAGADPWPVAPPEVPARAFVLVEAQSGAELAARDADRRLPPASLTKLMTAYLLFDDLRAGRLKLDEPVTVSREAAHLPGARMFLLPGETVTVENLLQGMLVQSGNDATRALVEHVSGDQATFVARMNAEAARLGLANTRFVNAGGLHRADHYSSARDLARLSVALRRDFPEYRRWFAQRSFEWAGIAQPNRNRLLRDPGVDGLKTGHTEASGFSIAASSERDGMQLIAVVLGADSEFERTRAARTLLDYGFRQFETRVVQRAGPVLPLPVWQGERDAVLLGVSADLIVTLPRGGFESLTTEASLPTDQRAPVERGQALGRLMLRHHGRVVGERPLVALDDVAVGSLFKRAGDRLRLWFRGQGVAHAAR